MKTTSALVALTAVLALPAFADEARVAEYTAQLRSVRVTEISRETAKLVVAKADVADAVTAAVKVNGPSAPLVVGAVSKASPASAAVAAATAVKLQPKLAGPISKAAVSAASAELEAIVGAMCKAQPASFYVIGVNAANAAPKSSDKVLPAITTALPALKPLIARSQAEFAAARRAASLALVLKHTEDMLVALSRDTKESPEALLAQADTAVETKYASLAKAAPVQLPPFVPGGGTPGEINAGATAEVPPGGRVYSSP
jgi:hypothetical protein